MHKQIEEMSQQILVQVQSNRQQAENWQTENRDLKDSLNKAHQDIHALKSIL